MVYALSQTYQHLHEKLTYASNTKLSKELKINSKKQYFDFKTALSIQF